MYLSLRHSIFFPLTTRILKYCLLYIMSIFKLVCIDMENC